MAARRSHTRVGGPLSIARMFVLIAYTPLVGRTHAWYMCLELLLICYVLEHTSCAGLSGEHTCLVAKRFGSSRNGAKVWLGLLA